MRMSSTEQIVIDNIAKTCKIERERVLLGATLKDLDVHSLDAVQVLFEIEDHYDISVPERDDRYATGTCRTWSMAWSCWPPAAGRQDAPDAPCSASSSPAYCVSAWATATGHLGRHAREAQRHRGTRRSERFDLRTPVAAQIGL
jgi:acyl carrier protein